MVDMKVKGFREIEREMMKLSRTGSKASARRILKKAGGITLAATLPKVPELSGALKDSYGVGTRLTPAQRRAARGISKSQVEVYVGASDPAAIQTEFGNAHQSAEPHLRPAWDGTRYRVLEFIKDELWADVQKAIGRQARRAAKARR